MTNVGRKRKHSNMTQVFCLGDLRGQGSSSWHGNPRQRSRWWEKTSPPMVMWCRRYLGTSRSQALHCVPHTLTPNLQWLPSDDKRFLADMPGSTRTSPYPPAQSSQWGGSTASNSHISRLAQGLYGQQDVSLLPRMQRIH